MIIGDLFEGVVSRRGNKLQVGSLELQLYPDHIFYVVSGGKDADLSIYKDGTFKPSRTNEIYLKDAASRGVPQAFINLFSKFFATQDIDIVVNGLEALFRSHVKEEFQPKFGKYWEQFEFRYNGKVIGLILTTSDDRFKTYRKIPGSGNNRLVKKHKSREDAENYLISKYKEIMGNKSLDEGRYNEIFLKGLIGAILSGGLSLGIDYAKEKTADYDRQGLQSIYKSIDPREYPQLTKKLTPHDRKGLDAILGKLKEHAMKMEDLSEGNKVNKEKKNAVVKRPDPKDKVSNFDPRRDLKKKVAEEDKRMSRAGKGVMKYGKDGMKALAKAGRDGASEEKLDKLRDKYDKYDESVLDEMPSPYNMRTASRNRNVQMKDKMKDRGSPKSYRQPGEPSKADLRAAAAKAKADYDKKKGIKESDDHEASMAKGQLYNACKNAMALYKMIEDGDNLEGWVAAKITKAADYLNAVHDHLAHEEISEEKQRLDPKCWKGYRKAGTKMKGGVRVNNCVKVNK